MQPPVTDRPVRLYAADVARNYASAAGATERSTQEEITWVAMEIGEHLAERGIAGEWNAIDGVSLGLFVLTGELADRIPFLNHLGRMLVWLTEELLIPHEDALRIMTDLHRTLTPCRMTQRLLDKPLLRLESLDMPAIHRRREAEKKYFLIPQIITDPPQWETPPETTRCDPYEREKTERLPTVPQTAGRRAETIDAHTNAPRREASWTDASNEPKPREPPLLQASASASDPDPANHAPPIELPQREPGTDLPPEAA